MDLDLIRGTDVETIYAVPNLHHKAKAAVGNMYGLTFNKNELLHLSARISEVVTAKIQEGL